MKSKDFDLDFTRRERYTYTKIFPRRGKAPADRLEVIIIMSVSLNTKHLSSFISEEEYAAIYPQVEAAHKQLEAKSGPGNDFLGWMYLPRDYDKEEFARIKEAAKKIREDSDVLVVAGIGGSYLGARAVVEAVKGMYHNEIEAGLKIYFCGNSISPTYLNNIISLCKGKRFSINVISKSGTTTETSLAFRVLRELLEKEMGVEEANKRIYATTDRAKGTLKQLADAQGWPTFVVPDDVGGRYSVLSAVGLLPIAAAGIDIDELMKGAADAMERFSVLSPDNDAYKYAAIRNILYRKGKSVEILECYEPDFTLMNEWYKQLFGESEGKDNKLHLLHRPALHGSVHSGRLPRHVRDHRGCEEARAGSVHRPAGRQLRRPELPGKPEHERGQPQGHGGHHSCPHRRRCARGADRSG